MNRQHVEVQTLDYVYDNHAVRYTGPKAVLSVEVYNEGRLIHQLVYQERGSSYRYVVYYSGGGTEVLRGEHPVAVVKDALR